RMLMGLRDWLPGAPALSQAVFGVSAQRPLPRWHRRPFRADEAGTGGEAADLLLFADTFNTWFEPDNLRSAVRVLAAVGRRVEVAKPADGSRRPLCCGRTFLAAGLVEEARAEAKRLVAALLPHVRRGIP